MMSRFKCTVCHEIVEFEKRDDTKQVICPVCQTVFTIIRKADKKITLMIDKTQPVPTNQRLGYTPPVRRTINRVPLKEIEAAKDSGLFPSYPEIIFDEVSKLGSLIRRYLALLWRGKLLRGVGVILVCLFVVLGVINISGRISVARSNNTLPVSSERAQAVGWFPVQQTYEQKMEYKFNVGISSDKMIHAVGFSPENLSSIQFVGHTDGYSYAAVTIIDKKRLGEGSIVQPLLMTFMGAFLQEWSGGPTWVIQQIENANKQPGLTVVTTTNYKDVHLTLQVDRSLGVVSLVLQRQ